MFAYVKRNDAEKDLEGNIISARFVLAQNRDEVRSRFVAILAKHRGTFPMYVHFRAKFGQARPPSAEFGRALDRQADRLTARPTA